MVLSHPSTTSGGVGIIFSKSFTPESLEVEEVVEGRLLVVRAKVEQFYLVFMNVYALVSGPDRVCFLKVLDTTKVKIDDFLFLGGDFNCTEACFRQEPPGAPQSIAACTEAAAAGPRPV